MYEEDRQEHAWLDDISDWGGELRC